MECRQGDRACFCSKAILWFCTEKSRPFLEILSSSGWLKRDVVCYRGFRWESQLQLGIRKLNLGGTIIDIRRLSHNNGFQVAEDLQGRKLWLAHFPFNWVQAKKLPMQLETSWVNRKKEFSHGDVFFFLRLDGLAAEHSGQVSRCWYQNGKKSPSPSVNRRLGASGIPLGSPSCLTAGPLLSCLSIFYHHFQPDFVKVQTTDKNSKSPHFILPLRISELSKWF